jgi:hypothetical protein
VVWNPVKTKKRRPSSKWSTKIKANEQMVHLLCRKHAK